MAQDIVEVFVTAEKALEQGATLLAQAGADEATTKAVTQLADTVREIVKALGKGQAQTADNAAPAPDPNATPDTMAGAHDHLAAAMAGGQ